MAQDQFWRRLDALVMAGEIVVDRPRGSAHPRYPEFTYPLDYGYLAGTASTDGSGVDVWLGSLPHRDVTAVAITVDLVKRDVELKLLCGCAPDEIDRIEQVHQTGDQMALILRR